jgi:hypothetical protein
MVQRAGVIIGLLFSLVLSGCSAEDRAKMVCNGKYETILQDCYAGVDIADRVSLEYAKEHRLLPIAWVPDNDEIRPSIARADAECRERTHGDADRAMACIQGVRAYLRQIEFLNGRVGQR